jgi:uncharacterized protein
MNFEWDDVKSSSNLEKHGISFESASRLWEDPQKLEVAARCIDEPRYAIIAQYKEKIWTVIYTLRNGRIRIISARRAREQEETHYYENQNI